MKRVILKSCSVVLLLLGLANIADYIYASAATNATTSNLSMQATILPSMTVVIDDTNPTLNITPSSTGTFDSTSINVSAYSNGSIGYNLTMTPSDTDLTGVRTGDTIPTLTSGSYTSANFPTGYWGVAVDSGNYVPAAVTNLASASSSNANVSNATHAVNLAANLDLTTAMDSYSTTLTFAATATVQAYPVTFNFDSGFTSLAIKDANNNTKATISTSGTSVSLDFANTYTIVPTYANDTDFRVSWVSGSGYLNGENLTYTVGSGSATVEFASMVYMQEFKALTASKATSIKNAMVQDRQYHLKDNRDENTYTIAKLADNNVWMTQNLDHDIVTTTNFYTPANTDIVANWTAPAATRVTADTTWDRSGTIPESYDPGNLCWNGVRSFDQAGSLANNTVACNADNMHYSVGNYYNWSAAVAMSDTSSISTDKTDVDQSICPAGWRLSTYSGDKSYNNLVNALGITADDSNLSPAHFAHVGRWLGTSTYVGATCSYWTSVVIDTTEAYRFLLGSLQPQSNGNRSYGNSIRCVAR